MVKQATREYIAYSSFFQEYDRFSIPSYDGDCRKTGIEVMKRLAID